MGLLGALIPAAVSAAGSLFGGGGDKSSVNEEYLRQAMALANEAAGGYRNLAKYGIYGQGGVGKLYQQALAQSIMQRANARRKFRAAYGRRYGPRAAGAADIASAGVYGDMIAGNLDYRRRLSQENETSKLGGYQGLAGLAGGRTAMAGVLPGAPNTNFFDALNAAIQAYGAAGGTWGGKSKTRTQWD